MISILRGFVRSIPTLILSFFLAVAVWISAVNAADPVVQRSLARQVTIERVGQNADLVILNEVPNQMTVSISAPQSVWDRITNDRASVRASVDLTGLGPGTHTVPVTVNVLAQPAKIVSRSPQTVSVTLETLVTREMPLRLVRRGEPAVGFQADDVTLSQDSVLISGPSSLIESVKEARLTLDITQASDSISRNIEVLALDANEVEVGGVTVTPPQVLVEQPISQRGGYRNVAVKFTSSGQIAEGYRLTSMSVFPPTVTVFSSNPSLIDRLPGFVETSPLDLTGVRDDIEIRLPLNLPNGVEVVGEQTVLVQVGVAAIEGSLTFSGLPVQVIDLPEDLVARISPQAVDVIISGPVLVLDRLTEQDVRVFLDLSGVEAGTYQFVPKVNLSISDLKVESILPSSIEVIVQLKSQVTATPTPTLRPTTPAFTPTPGD